MSVFIDMFIGASEKKQLLPRIWLPRRMSSKKNVQKKDSPAVTL